jgi:small conductance mechanosensitive channel
VFSLALDPTLVLVLRVTAAIVIGLALGYAFDRTIRRVGKKIDVRPQTIRRGRQASALVFTILAGIAVILLLVQFSDVVWLGLTTLSGLAITLALQSTLSNMLAGLLNAIDGIIQVGDQIEVGGIAGTVTHVGLRHSWIRTKDGSITVISNSTVSAGPLKNYSLEDRIKKRTGPLSWYQTYISRLSPLLDKKNGEEEQEVTQKETRVAEKQDSSGFVKKVD